MCVCVCVNPQTIATLKNFAVVARLFSTELGVLDFWGFFNKLTKKRLCYGSPLPGGGGVLAVYGRGDKQPPAEG